MKLLEIKPKLFKFKTVSQFIKEFNVGEKDVIFTNKRLYGDFFEKLNLKCKYILKDKYKFNEPNDVVVDSILDDIKNIDFNRIIAIGGGSIIDVSKLLALKNVESTEKLFKKEIPIIKDRELIIIPTTCGTGSEVTNISIAEIKSEKIKLGLAVDELYADYAVLIPELCRTIPYKFFIYSSIDALIHSIESYLSPKSNSYTEMYSIEAIKIIIDGYKKIIKNGEEYRKEILENFLIASNYAGIAFGNAGVGAVHALSYPLGGKYHVPHGESNYEFLISVLQFYNNKDNVGKINNLNKCLSDILNVPMNEVYAQLEKILEKLIKRKPLREYGMREKDIYNFAESVIVTQQRLLKNNYVPMNKEDIVNIYKKLY